MNSNTDLTLFWRAWQKTCSVRLCCAGHDREYQQLCSSAPDLCEQMDEVHALAKDVIKSMNNRFASLLKKKETNMRISEFSSESDGWGSGVSQGSAFELLESHLYSREFLNGKQFKAYLFEDVAERPGGMNKNLFGYLQRVLSTVVAESYGESIYQPSQDKDGDDIEPATISTDGCTSVAGPPAADAFTEAHEVEGFFRAYLSEHERSWASDHWLILYCILNMLRVGAANVRPLFAKGHQTINEWASQMKSDLLLRLRKDFSDKAIGLALMGPLQEILEAKVRPMPWYPRANELREENRRTTGK